ARRVTIPACRWGSSTSSDDRYRSLHSTPSFGHAAGDGNPALDKKEPVHRFLDCGVIGIAALLKLYTTHLESGRLGCTSRGNVSLPSDTSIVSFVVPTRYW